MNAAVEPGIRFTLTPALEPALVRQIREHCWPLARLADAVTTLARLSGVDTRAAELTTPVTIAVGDLGELPRWLDWAGSRLGVEIESVDAQLSEVPSLLRDAAPSLLPLSIDGVDFLLLVCGRRGRELRLMGPDGVVRTCSLAVVRDVLCWNLEAPLIPAVDELLEVAAVPARSRRKVRETLLQERVGRARVGPLWLVRLPPGATLAGLSHEARLPQWLGAMLALVAIGYVVELGGWTIIGDALLGGRVDWGWFAAWALLGASLVPLRLATGWCESVFSLSAARLIKARLFAGALAMDLSRLRHEGVGHLLGRVMESQSLESAALHGALAVLVALVEGLFAAWVLSQGAGGGWHLGLFLLWVGLTLILAVRYQQRLAQWTRQRLDMTHALVERMIGHRTRLAQEVAARRDAADDRSMERYLECSRLMDRAVVPLVAGVPMSWLLVALVGFAPALLAATPPGAASLAIGLGGILLAQRMLVGLTAGLASLARAVQCWRLVRDMFGAEPPEPPRRPFLSLPMLAGTGGSTPLVEASGVSYGYPGNPVLDRLDLVVRRGDHLLVEGPSGAGKSTLATLLSGLATPDSGLLLLNGLDRHTLGEDWHRLVTQAPQFHDNHILGGPLAFNLLMGRQWPASPAEIEEARLLCEALGLGPLLERMPAGIMQRVGETGWQLSHGERSRVFLARALLQRAQLTIFDESFAALDPETLGRCLEAVGARAQTMMVVAHP